MATVAELRQRPHMRHAYLLLIDGCQIAFTDEYDLTTMSGSGWWTADDRVLLPGLQVPNITMSLDWETGLLEDNAVTFKVLDVDETTLPGFFGTIEKPYRLLGTRLTPGEDPAPSPTADQYGDALTLHDGSAGCYLGTEAIGPDGERHYYSCLPWLSATWPGEDHGVSDEPLTVHTTSAIGPYLVEGRRVTLFRLVYDEDTQSWPAPQDQYEGGTLLWWGKLRSKGKVDGRTWSFSCSGPASWLVKTLNSRAPTEWYKVGADLEFGAFNRHIRLGFYKRGVGGTLLKFGWDPNTYEITAGPVTLDQVVSDIQTAIAAVKVAAGIDGVWTDDTPVFGAAASVTFTAEGVSVSTAGDCGYAAIMSMSLHWTVWRALGYDPEAGLRNHDGPQPQFAQDFFFGEGYYVGHFSTTPFGPNVWATDDPQTWDGDGIAHIYQPLYPGGLVVISGAGGTSIRLSKPDGGFDGIYCESQTIRPPYTGQQYGGLDTNSTRWWVFKGKIQRPTGLGTVGEPEDIYQVAKCSWVSTTGEPGLIYQADGLNADLYIERWEDPRLFGLNYEPIDPEIGWAGTVETGEGSLYASPLAVWGLWEKTPDEMTRALYRILVTTGSGAWDGTPADNGDDQLQTDYPVFEYLLPGDNQSGDVPATEPFWGDVEIADLGLAIPYQMVDYHAFFVEGLGLPKSLQEGKLVAHGPVESEDLIRGILSPRDWALRLHGGKYGIYRRTEEQSVQDADVTITISDLAGEAGDPASTWPEAELRGTDPVDRFSVKYCADPTETPTEGALERALKARDLGSRARAGKRTLEVQAPDLRAREWWTEGPAPVQDWTIDLKKLWEQQVCGFLAKPNRKLTLRVSRPKGQDLYPGTLVSLTDPRPPNSSGGYGLSNAVARVISVTHEADSCAATVELLVQAAAGTQQVWAPIARVIDDVATLEERYEGSSRTFFLREWEDPSGNYGYNLAAFEEPEWSTAGGSARFWVLQYDGTTWTKTCEGNVESVDVGAGTLTHTVGGLSGTFYSRMYAVLVMAPYDDADQVAWPKSVFSLLGPPAGLAESVKMAK